MDADYGDLKNRARHLRHEVERARELVEELPGLETEMHETEEKVRKLEAEEKNQMAQSA